MAETKKIMAEFLRTLRAYARSGRPESLVALRDLLRDLDKVDAVHALGCPEACERCTWGLAQPLGLKERCVLYLLMDALEDAPYRGRRGDAELQRLAAGALDLFERAPGPGSR